MAQNHTQIYPGVSFATVLKAGVICPGASFTPTWKCFLKRQRWTHPEAKSSCNRAL